MKKQTDGSLQSQNEQLKKMLEEKSLALELMEQNADCHFYVFLFIWD
jgi:hypothetical protein